MNGPSAYPYQGITPFGWWWRIAIVLFASPGAWLVQMWLSEPTAAHACFPKTHVLPSPEVEHLSALLLGVGVAAMLIAFSATGFAWIMRRRVRLASASLHPRRFLVEIGLLGSASCSIAVVFTLIAALLVGPCRPWA